MPESLSNLPDYVIWYCPEYPTPLLRTGQFRPEFTVPFQKLKKDIAERGLINPLIILNHRPTSDYKRDWVMTGRNRLYAIRALGWRTVPAIVTGMPSKGIDGVRVDPARLQDYFRDGEVYFGNHGPTLRNVSRFEFGEYPK